TQTLPGRTYGGFVQIMCFFASTVQFGSGAGETLAFCNGLFIAAHNNGQNETVDASTNNPTGTITGNLEFKGNSGATGLEVINAGTGTWTVGGTVDFNDVGGQAGTYTPGTGNLLKMNPSSGQTINTGGNSLYKFEAAGTNTVTLANNITTA